MNLMSQPKTHMPRLCRGMDFGCLKVLSSALLSIYELQGESEGSRVFIELLFEGFCVTQVYKN